MRNKIFVTRADFTFDLQRFAPTETFEGGVYTLTTDKGTLKLSGLKNIYDYRPTFDETNNLVDVNSVAVAEGGTLTVVENTTDCDIRLWGKNFTLVGSSGNDKFIFANVEPNVTIKYNVGSSGDDYIGSTAAVDMTTVKLQFVTADGKPVAYSTKWSDNNLIVTVGDNTITYVNFGAGDVSVDNGVGLMKIDGLNVNVDDAGNGYYEISSAADLQTLANYVNSNDVNSIGNTSGKVFKLTADISDWTGVNFTGIGNGDRSFSGTFDGNGFTISNLTINGEDNVGLFGYSYGTIQNVKLDNVNISGKDDVGALVGYNDGTVTNCTVTNATVSGDEHVGGLIGWNEILYSSVTGNKVDATVSGNRIVGSLVGYMANGTLTGNDYHGNAGDVGANDKGTISNTRLYSVAVSGAEFTVDSDPITIGTNTYYASGSTVTVEGQTFALGSDLSLAKVTYLDTDGTKSEVVHVLTGNETSLAAGTYIVNDNINLDTLSLSGNVNLILADGKTLTVNNISGGNLTVFGQSGGTGALTVTGTIATNTLNFNNGTLTAGTISGTLNFNGGTLTANTISGTLNFNGGTLTANTISGTLNFNGGTLTADTISGNVNLDWTQDTDTLTATNLSGTMTVADGKRFYDTAGNIYSGTTNTAPNGKLSVLDGVRLDLPEGVTITSDHTQVGNDIYVKAGATVTLNFDAGLDPTKYRVNGELITDAPNNQYTFTMGGDITSVSADQYTFSVSGETVQCFDDGKLIFTLSGVQNLNSSIINGNVVTLNAENFTGSNVELTDLDGEFVFDIPRGKTLNNLSGKLTSKYSSNPSYEYSFKFTLDSEGNTVYAINSIDDLDTFEQYINSANAQLGYLAVGQTFKLTADIDLSGVSNWTSIGNGDKTKFCGTFDGGGHVISNLTCTGNSRNGLFGTVNDNGTVKNVTLINANVSGGSYNGALVGCNRGTVTNNKYQSNVGDVGWRLAGTVNNTRLYTFTTTSGVTAEYTGTDDLKVTFGGKTYYASGATFTITVDPNNFSQYHKVKGVSGATANDDGTYTATIENADLNIKIAGYPKIAGLAFDDTTDTYTIADTQDLIDIATFIGGGGDISGLSFNFTATEYEIGTLDELQGLAGLVNGGGDTSGLTFKLTQNIGGVNFHIGDSDAHRFKGTLDGNGKTITVNYNSTTENCALFNYVEGATIKKLTVDGTINTSAKFAAGIAAQTSGTTTISDCRSSVTINSTVNGDGTHGGFVGVLNDTTNITNCIFDGKLLTTNGTTHCGGFVGWKSGTLNITNSIFAPAEVSIGTSDSATFARNGVNSLSGGYYTQTFNAAQNGTQVYRFAATLPDDVTTDTSFVEIGGSKFIKAGTINLTHNDITYSYNVNSNVTSITTTDSGISINGTALEMPYPYTLETDADGYKLITSAEQLSGLAAYVNAGNNCAGYKFKLTTDIENFTDHIGDSDAHKFAGTLDGDEHKITVNYNGGALFNYVDGATIKKLTVDGTINTSAKYAAGIAAQTSGTTTISDCRSSVTINSSVSGDGTHGGFVAGVSGTTNISNSIFDGSLLSVGKTETNSCGGFVGWNGGTLNITDSLFNPTSVSIGTSNSATFARNGVNKLDGGYYTQTFNDAQGGTQVYKLTLNGVTATGDTVITFGNDTYAAGEVIIGGKSYTVNGDMDFSKMLFYIGADGTAQTIIDYTILTADTTTLNAGWYVVKGNITINETLTLSGNVHLILADGAELTVVNTDEANDDENYDGGVGIDAWNYDNDTGYTLNIYGQTLGTGKLNATGYSCGISADNVNIYGGQVTATSTNSDGINAGGDVKIYGGTVTATSDVNGIRASNVNIYGGQVTATSTNSDGIFASNAVNINGGQVTATGGDNGNGINAYGGAINLSWTNADDFIDASSYNKTPNFTKRFYDASGNINPTSGKISALDGYIVTIPAGVTIESGTATRIGTTNKYICAANAELTLSAKTGYTLESSTVTIAGDTTISATFDTANHYVLADDTSTLATESNTATYPDLIKVYKISLPANVTASGANVIIIDNNIYAVSGANVTFDAGTGRAIKPVTIENTDIEITAADIFYTVNIPDGFEIVADDEYKYTINDTTYYKSGAQLILRTDGTATEVAIEGGETLAKNSDGTYSFTIGGVTTITGNYHGRDPNMSEQLTQYTIKGSTESTGITVYVDTANNKIYSDEAGTKEITWLQYDGSNFTAPNGYLEVSDNTLKVYTNAEFTIGDDNTATASGTATSIDGFSIIGSNSSIGYAANINDYLSVSGSNIQVKQAAVDDGVTQIKSKKTDIVAEANCELANTTKYWGTGDDKFTCYTPASGDRTAAGAGSNRTYTYTITPKQALFTISGLPSEVTPSDCFDIDDNTISVKDTARTQLTGTTITLTNSTETVYSFAQSIEQPSPSYSLEGTEVKKTTGEYEYISNDGLSYTYHAAGTETIFTISGLKTDANPEFNASTYTITLDADDLETTSSIQLTATDKASANDIANFKFALSLSDELKYYSSPATVDTVTNGFTYTAGNDNPGYQLSSDGKSVVYVSAASAGGGERFTITGITGLTEAILLSGVTKDATSPPTFTIDLPMDAPTSGDISIKSVGKSETDNSYTRANFVLKFNGAELSEAEHKLATLSAQGGGGVSLCR